MVVDQDCVLADLDFQGKHGAEKFAFYFHQHWIRLLWPLVKMIAWNILIIGGGYATFTMAEVADDFTRRLLLNFLTVFFVIAHFELLVRLYRYFLYVVVVTDKKIHRIKKTLIMFDDHQSIDLWMLQDINKCQHGIVQNLFGFGSIILEVQETILRLHFVPHIEHHYHKFMGLREQARNKMAYYGGSKSSKKSRNYR
jgi:hypothetical protein